MASHNVRAIFEAAEAVLFTRDVVLGESCHTQMLLF